MVERSHKWLYPQRCLKSLLLRSGHGDDDSTSNGSLYSGAVIDYIHHSVIIYSPGVYSPFDDFYILI